MTDAQFFQPPKGYRTDFYATGNLTLYYTPNTLTPQDCGSDFLVVLGTKR